MVLQQRDDANDLYQGIQNLAIISPHGHCDPMWFAENTAFFDPAELLVVPDHYVFRMLYSQGIALRDLGIRDQVGGTPTSHPLNRRADVIHIAHMLGVQVRHHHAAADSFFEQTLVTQQQKGLLYRLSRDTQRLRDLLLYDALTRLDTPRQNSRGRHG